jgi:hypothetical protein
LWGRGGLNDEIQREREGGKGRRDNINDPSACMHACEEF